MKDMNMFQTNNILGFSYVKTIKKHDLPIEPFTVKRLNSDYHEEVISHQIASATSIRKELKQHEFSEKVVQALPKSSLLQLELYKHETSVWHSWEDYFPFLHYRVMTMSKQELATIQGVDEGIEYRIKDTANDATSFFDWLEKIKTRRYTYVRLQRMFVHILTNTKKKNIAEIITAKQVPYLRLLGMSKSGQAYLNAQKHRIDIPMVTNLNKSVRSLLMLDEKATNTYYSILPTHLKKKMRKQEFALPIRL